MIKIELPPSRRRLIPRERAERPQSAEQILRDVAYVLELTRLMKNEGFGTPPHHATIRN